MERLFLVMAHPDDAEIWAGGTLLNHSQRNDEIIICYLFPENDQRKCEAKKIKQFINADVVFIDDKNQQEELLENILAFKPTSIITHWQEDPHYEHRITSECLAAVIHRARAVHKVYFTLFACDSYYSKGIHPHRAFTPNYFIDISGVWDTKVKMITKHESQPTDKLITMIDAQNKLHGLSTGTTYAEAFLQLPVLGIMNKREIYLPGFRGLRSEGV